MSQSLAQIYLHIIFSTKNRRPFLQDASIRDETHKYLGGTCNNLDCPVLCVGGVADQVRARMGRTLCMGLMRRQPRHGARDDQRHVHIRPAITIA
jgi:Transposase IS200 like